MGWFSRKAGPRLTKVSALELRGRQTRNQLQIDAVRDELVMLGQDYARLTQPRGPGETEMDIQIRANAAKQVADRRKLRAVDLTAQLQAASQISLLVAYAERVGEGSAILEQELESLLRLDPAQMRRALENRTLAVERATVNAARRSEILGAGTAMASVPDLDHSEEMRLIEDASPAEPAKTTPSIPTKTKEPRDRVADFE